MRKIVIAGVAALGLLAVGLTVMGHTASYNQAQTERGTDVRVTRRSPLAMIDTDQTSRPVLAANVRSAGLARSLLV
jgi:hypothetical protein